MCSFPRIRYILWIVLIIPILGLVFVLSSRLHNGSSNVLPLSTTTAGICAKPCILGDESILMKSKEYGTSSVPIQSNLRWNCDNNIANRICNYNRHYAEYFGYWERDSTFIQDEVLNNSTDNASLPTTINFYDSNTGVPLFTIPGILKLRTIADFLQESRRHGWPSFRTDEVHWDYVRVLPNGETVSISGTHLGHNLPDTDGDRFCINLVCIAGNPL
jgi:hypothetical protein